MSRRPSMSTFARSFDALIAVLLALFAIGALVSLCGCTRPFWTTDETVYGVEFDWGSQADRATVDTLLCRCADAIGGGRHLTGARVKFLDDYAAVTKACARPDPELVAGCWSTLLDDMVLLSVASRLVDTALCEELAHRARYYAKGQVAGAEDPWHCDRALWDELGVPETPGKCRH